MIFGKYDIPDFDSINEEFNELQTEIHNAITVFQKIANTFKRSFFSNTQKKYTYII